MKTYRISRRNFLGTSAAAGLTSLTFPTLITGCASEKKEKCGSDDFPRSGT